MFKMLLLSCLTCCLLTPVWSASSTYKDAHKAVKNAIKSGKKEPTWFKSTTVHWDMSKPWKEGRMEIRRLLGFNEAEKSHEAMKILYLYKSKEWDKVMGEWGEYPFLAGEHEMALVHYLDTLPKITKYEPTHAKQCLAALYEHYGAYDKAMDTLSEAHKRVETKDSSKFKIMRLAHLHEAMGDLSVKMEDIDAAKTHYQTAADLFPTSNQPYGKEKLKPSSERCKRKIARLDIANLANAQLKDGTYTAQQQAYSGVLKLQVTIKNNKISACRVSNHKEKIHQGAIETIPARILELQTVEVDAVLGATVTSDAIKDCTFQCLKRAGL